MQRQRQRSLGLRAWFQHPQLRPQVKVLWVLLGLVLLGMSLQSFQRGYSSGHFEDFTLGGHKLLRGLNPYGQFFQCGPYFYSIFCGWLFGVIDFLPHPLGLFLYRLASWVLLGEVTAQWLLTGFQAAPQKKSNCAAAAIAILGTSELLGGVSCAKLEVLMMAGLMWAGLAWQRHPILSGAVAASMVNFKFFPLAPVGLLAVALLNQKKRGHGQHVKFVLSCLITFSALALAPLLVYGPKLALTMMHTQKASLSAYTLEHYAQFLSIFGFLTSILGKPPSVNASLAIAGMTALFLIGLMLWCRISSSEKALWAIALGSLYATNFNLLSQKNSFITGYPGLLFGVMLCCGGGTTLSLTRVQQGLLRFSVGFYWIIVSYIHSDLFPKLGREWASHYHIKPLGSFVLMFFLALVLWQHRQDASRDQPKSSPVEAALPSPA